MRHLVLTSLAFVWLGLSVEAAEPQFYTLRIEELGVEIDRPLPAGQKPVDLSTVKDELIASTEIDVQLGKPFRVRMKRGREVRILSGRPAADWDDQNRLRLDITYAILRENPDREPDRTSSQAASLFKIGEPQLLGGMVSTGTSTTPDGEREQHRRIKINATLLERTQEEEFEKSRGNRRSD